MTRATIFVSAAAGLAFAVLAWMLPNAQGLAPQLSAALLSRSAGLVLLGIALLAAGLVFRAAAATPPLPASKVPVRAGEFRRGFGKPVVHAHPQPRFSREVVVALRRGVVEQAERAATAPRLDDPPVNEVTRLQDLIQSRAAQLRARDAERGTRGIMRPSVDVDLDGLAPR